MNYSDIIYVLCGCFLGSVFTMVIVCCALGDRRDGK